MTRRGALPRSGAENGPSEPPLPARMLSQRPPPAPSAERVARDSTPPAPPHDDAGGHPLASHRPCSQSPLPRPSVRDAYARSKQPGSSPSSQTAQPLPTPATRRHLPLTPRRSCASPPRPPRSTPQRSSQPISSPRRAHRLTAPPRDVSPARAPRSPAHHLDPRGPQPLDTPQTMANCLLTSTSYQLLCTHVQPPCPGEHPGPNHP